MDNVTTATPAQIDAQIAHLHQQIDRAESTVNYALDSIHRRVRDTQTGPRTSRRWTMTHDEARAALREQAPDTADLYEKDLTKAQDAVAEHQVALAPLTAEFQRRGGWSRFYLAKSSNGHIHSSMDCSTCNRNFKATQFGWLTDLSGMSEEAAVEAHGAILCTVCFPSAPLDWTNKYEAEAEKKKAERCPGSGRYMNSDLPHRKGYASGNWATCPECGDKVTLTSALNLRAHKPPKA